MKKQQVLAFMMAAVLAIQPQVVSAADTGIKEEVIEESVEKNVEVTENGDVQEDAEEDQEVDVQENIITEQKSTAKIMQQAASVDDVEGKLATVRVTKTDVYGIVGGKASLVGNYDQGIPAVPKDGVAWCFGDKTEIKADAEKYVNPESTTMTLRNITAEQDGSQYCLSVKNALGTAYSPVVTLHVLDASVKNQTVLSGADATFTVEKTGDWGSVVKYQWYKGDEKIAGATKASYTVEDATSADAGEYKCVIQRGYGSADEYNSKTVTAVLEIKSRVLDAKITNVQEGEIISTGTVVTIKAQAIGDWDTDLTYQWYDKNGNVLKDGDIYMGVSTDTLTLKADATLDGNGYYCVISGQYGSAQTDTYVLNIKAEEMKTPDTEQKADVVKTDTEKSESTVKKVSVQTGDYAETGIWTILSGFSLIGILEVIRRRRVK